MENDFLKVNIWKIYVMESTELDFGGIVYVKAGLISLQIGPPEGGNFVLDRRPLDHCEMCK